MSRNCNTLPFVFNSRCQPLKRLLFRRSPFLYKSKNLNCIGALSFLRLEEEYWRSPFLINFIGVNFEAGNETRKKIWRDFVAEQNEEWSEKSGFFISLFSRKREIEV